MSIQKVTGTIHIKSESGQSMIELGKIDIDPEVGMELPDPMGSGRILVKEIKQRAGLPVEHLHWDIYAEPM